MKVNGYNYRESNFKGEESENEGYWMKKVKFDGR